jgi:cytochrome c-type biogenesis protein CcmH
MTTFIIVAAAMVAAALLWLVVPLFRAKTAEGQDAKSSSRMLSAVALVVFVPALAAVMYASLSNWDWQAIETDVARTEQLDGLLKQLEDRLQANPEDLNGWLLLGRSYTSMQRFPQAIRAYERAYALDDENVDAMLGLGEALAMQDGSQLNGRAGELFERALTVAPMHPKALWYGSMAALQAGELRKGRDRLQALLQQGPPEELRAMLERQIQALDEQIGDSGASVAATGEGSGVTSSRTIKVSVSIAPQLQEKLDRTAPLFVLARDPAGGPPLAAQRLSASQLPLTVELSERDAMMPTRTIAQAQKVQVVARVSKSGTPQAQSGDLFGQADYEFGKDTGTLNIRIDQVVP